MKSQRQVFVGWSREGTTAGGGREGKAKKKGRAEGGRGNWFGLQ